VNLLDAPSKLVSALPGQAVSGLAVGRAMRVNVDIEFDHGRRTAAQVVILLLEGGEEPYRILSWRDDFDGLTVEQIGSWDQ
jgi:general secretion pathway protein K